MSESWNEAGSARLAAARSRRARGIVWVAAAIALGGAACRRGGGAPQRPRAPARAAPVDASVDASVAAPVDASSGASGGFARTSASPAVLAFFAPLRVGGTFEGATIIGISDVEDGYVHIGFRRGTADVHLTVGVPRDTVRGIPAGRVAVNIWSTPTQDAATLSSALARTLGEHADRPLPPGLAR